MSYFLLDVEVNYDSFSHHTRITWEGVSVIPKEAKIIYTSKSGSKYWRYKNFLFRKSKHWGQVGTCKWRIKHPIRPNGKKYGMSHYSNSDKGFFAQFAKPIIGVCSIDKVKYIAPKAPKRYIKDEKGFLIINPEFKLYCNSYNFASNKTRWLFRRAKPWKDSFSD